MLPSASRFIAAIAIIGLGIGSSLPARAETWRLTGRGGSGDWGETPLVAELEAAVPPGPYVLESGASGGSIDATVFEQGGHRWLGTVLPRVPARQEFAYRMKPQQTGGSPGDEGIRFQSHDRNLVIALADHVWTEYRLDVGHKPFFFPLHGPTGPSYTRAYPMQEVPGEDRDHPHQRSCWFTHGSVNGVDFWSEGPRAGTIRETERKVVVQGPALARLWTRNQWRAPDDRKVCEDERTATFFRTKGARVIDFDVRVFATDGPLTFGDTKEGMFGLRVASTMDVDRKTGGKITNAEGLTDAKAWGQASPWVDYVGPVQDKMVGIAILNHPQSFRFPTTWHVRTYGLFAANPFGWHDFGRSDRGDHTVPSGQSIRFAYRIILHEGDTPSARLSEQFEAYSRPPILEVRPE